METFRLVLGSTLLLLGLTLALTAVVRSLTNQWTWRLGVHELWILPLAALTLLVLGVWLVP